MTDIRPLAPLDPSLAPKPVAAGTRIGHVHLQVTDLDRALAFYQGVLGFELTMRYGGPGRPEHRYRLLPASLRE